jgi:predicted nucleic acid-binding protein
MSQVADASVVVAALLDGGAVGRWCVERLVEDDLVAPHLMPFEVGNIVRRTAIRGVVDGTAARQALTALTRLRVELVAFDPPARRVWELRDDLTAYDAAYVAVAELVGGRLVTLDGALSRADGPRCRVVAG